MMLAPSTVIAIGAACQLRPAKLRGPRMMPLPPSTSITSLDTSRAIVVQWYLAIADGTRGLAAVDRHRRGLRQRADRVGLAGDARQRFLDAFEAADRQAELLADARIGAGRDRAHLGAAAGGRGQGDRAADRQLLVEHLPALAGVVLAAKQLAERDEDLAAVDRAVLERRVEREVAAA